MRYWLHATITILGTFLAVIGCGVGLILFAINVWDKHPGVAWLVRVALIAGPLAALFGPTLLMSLVPVRCPKCGQQARYRFYAWGFSSGTRGFSFGPTFAYGCQSCPWCTYRWSSYQQSLPRRHRR